MRIEEAGTVLVGDMEQVILDLAATVVNSADTRRHHPTYAKSKATIRGERDRMEGAIGLYMVLTGQALHAAGPGTATFTSERVSERVAEARRIADAL